MCYYCTKLKIEQQSSSRDGLTPVNILGAAKDVIVAVLLAIPNGFLSAQARYQTFLKLTPYERQYAIKSFLFGSIDPTGHFCFRWNVGTLFWVLICAWLVPERLGFDTKLNRLSQLGDIVVSPQLV